MYNQPWGTRIKCSTKCPLCVHRAVQTEPRVMFIPLAMYRCCEARLHPHTGGYLMHCRRHLVHCPAHGGPLVLHHQSCLVLFWGRGGLSKRWGNSERELFVHPNQQQWEFVWVQKTRYKNTSIPTRTHAQLHRSSYTQNRVPEHHKPGGIRLSNRDESEKSGPDSRGGATCIPPSTTTAVVLR